MKFLKPVLMLSMYSLARVVNAIEPVEANFTLDAAANSTLPNITTTLNVTEVLQEITKEAEQFDGLYLDAPAINLKNNKAVIRLNNLLQELPLMRILADNDQSNPAKYTLVKQFNNNRLLANVKNKELRAQLFDSSLKLLRLLSDTDYLIYIHKSLFDILDELGGMVPEVLYAHICFDWIYANKNIVKSIVDNVENQNSAQNTRAITKFLETVAYGTKNALRNTVIIAGKEEHTSAKLKP